MVDNEDNAGGGFSKAVSLGLLLAGLLMMVLWLTTCNGNNRTILEAAKQDNEQQKVELLSAADGEKTAAIQSLTSDFEGKLGVLQEQIGGLEGTVSKLQDEKLKLESQVNSLNASLDESNAKVNEITTQSNSLVAEHDATVEGLNTEIEGQKGQIDDLNGTITKLTTEKTDLESSVSNKMTALGLLQSKFDDSQGTAEQNAASMKQEIVDYSRRIDNMNTELMTLRDTNTLLQSELDNVGKANSSQQAAMNTLQADTSSITERAAKLQEQVAVLSTENTDLKEQLTISEQELASVNEHLVQSRSQLNDTQAMLKQKTEAIALAATATAGAVSSELQQANSEVDRVTAIMGEQAGQIKSLNGELAQVKTEFDDLKAQFGDVEVLEEELVAVKAQLSDNMVTLAASAAELDDAKSLLEGARGELSAQALQLAAIPKSGEPTQEALTLKTDIMQKLHESGVKGAKVDVRNDSDVGILMSSAELFGSGRSFISSNGVDVMTKIAETLKNYPDHDIRIEGHTDNVPVGGAIKATFPSNWELSVARAASTVRFLQEAGIDAEQLSASGFGEYRPVADNATVAGRNENRRIEIMMVPRN